MHEVGEPRDVLVLEEVPESTGADLESMTMGLGGWEPMSAGRQPFTDWVVLEMSHAALALPDVTTARGTYLRSSGRRRVVRSVTGNEEPGRIHITHAIRRGGITAGETVVVLGAGGGVGSAMVQLAVAHGARVIAVVGGPEKVAFCESLGAEVVDHQAGDVVEGLQALTDSQGVDVILDPVQGDGASRIRAVLRPDGRHVLCGHAGGLQAHDPDFYLYNHTLVGATLGSYPRDEMRRLTDETHAALVALVADGGYRSTVTRCVAFNQVPDALTDLAARRTLGRVVVDVRS